MITNKITDDKSYDGSNGECGGWQRHHESGSRLWDVIVDVSQSNGEERRKSDAKYQLPNHV